MYMRYLHGYFWSDDLELGYFGKLPASQYTKVGGVVVEIGRNDPCPCGSGKKYKKCHGA